MATPGILAYIVTAKYADALPLYRQEKIFGRYGIDLSRVTMAGWMVKSAQACEPVMELFYNVLLSGFAVNIDETPVQVMKEPGRANTTKSYMWVFRGGPIEKPVVLKPIDIFVFYLKGFHTLQPRPTIRHCSRRQSNLYSWHNFFTPCGLLNAYILIGNATNLE